MIVNAFKNIVGTTFESDYTFKQADKLKEAAKNTVRAAPTAAAAAPTKAAVKEEVKEEEADVDMGGLFGDDY